MPIALLMMLAVAGAGLARQPAAAPDAARARQLLASIQQRLPEASREIKWLLGTLRDDTELPEEVIAELAGLDSALSAHGDDPKMRALVRDDLSIKSQYCRRHPEGMRAMVSLTVRTWQGPPTPTAEVSRWSVMYLSAPLAILRTKGEPFPQFSSPTSKRLPPGRYVIWAEDPADTNRRGPPRLVTLGAPTMPLDDPVSADIIVPESWR